MPPDDGSEGRRLALLVATATYADPGLAALRAPAGDVRSLAGVLGDDGIGGFDVRELIDRPTEELKREIEGFFGAGRPRDLLLLYVSGHGVLSQNRRFYLATATTALPFLRSTAIEDSFVNDVMQQSRARSIVLILDCCHSGAFGKGLMPKSAMSVDVEHRFEGRGRVTLTASTELEYAFEESDPATGINELGHVAPGSLFTRSVVEGLRSGDADIDEDGAISVDDLYDYVCRRIRDRSPNQTPGMAGDVRGQIVLARSARRAALPPELARAVTSNLAGIREGAVSELEMLLGGGGPEALAARAALERLAEDDSRAVSTAALEALGRPPTQLVEPKPKTEPERKPTPPPPPPPPPPPRRWWPFAAGAGGLVAVAIAAALLLGGGESPSPGPKGTAIPYDFDGDRTQYVVLGLAQAAKADGELHSGVVLAGEQGNDTRVLAGADAGVPGGDDENDRFGTAVDSGDFNGDGTPDLAISAPGRQGVAVMYNVRGGHNQWIPASALPGGSASGRFGFALLAGKFNRDKYADLVIGTLGTIHLLFGSAQGLRTDAARVIKPASPSDENIGANLRAGDISRDGNLDLVEGGEDATSAAGGHLSYCAGTAQGPKTCRDLDGGPTTSLAIADVDGNGRLDVVQGDARGTGRVQIWQGSKDGPRGPRTTIDQDRPGIPGVAKYGDEFGHDVIAADLDGDHKAEIIVAARRDGSDQRGSVTLIKGATDFRFDEARFLGYTATGGAHLGAALSLLDANGDHHLDLFAGVKSATETGGALVEYPGTSDGDLGRGTPWAGLKGLKVVVDRASPLRVGRD